MPVLKYFRVSGPVSASNQRSDDHSRIVPIAFSSVFWVCVGRETAARFRPRHRDLLDAMLGAVDPWDISFDHGLKLTRV